MTNSMLVTYDTTLVSPRNDGEAVTIVEIARCLGFDVRVSTQAWGATLEKEPSATFDNLKRNVVIIEMPGVEKENQLRAAHTVFVIDHHKYEGLDRSNPKSSLEQFADLIGYTLNRWEMGVALNDRGYITALEAHAFTEDEIRAIRKFDMQAQGLTDTDIATLTVDYANARPSPKGHVLVVTSRLSKTSYLSDLHYWKKKKGQTELDLLVLSVEKEGKLREASFYGAPDSVARLQKDLGGFSGGDPSTGMFWGKVFDVLMPNESEILSRIDDTLTQGKNK